mgnify:CR=1 FL=1
MKRFFIIITLLLSAQICLPAAESDTTLPMRSGDSSISDVELLDACAAYQRMLILALFQSKQTTAYDQEIRERQLRIETLIDRAHQRDNISGKLSRTYATLKACSIKLLKVHASSSLQKKLPLKDLVDLINYYADRRLVSDNNNETDEIDAVTMLLINARLERERSSSCLKPRLF